MTKPILCLDFDGVCHAYTSPWMAANQIPDPPVDGLFEFLIDADRHFRIAIFSSRSHQPGGVQAMTRWFSRHYDDWVERGGEDYVDILAALEFPIEKPPAFLTIDDRALTFTGAWPDVAALRAFKPWNKGGNPAPVDTLHETVNEEI